ncbi:multidrug effflux MFS transporter (plasmid) [Catenovulum sp. SX2]|uniref:multidrug effflux MFS transporter n=1 Tax=Catenovulum sp. SX2 TaxID=3398614 RepID=UPI003F85AE3F
MLAAIFTISPFAIDTYLPAITSIATDLQVEAEWVSMTVSLYVFGLAFGQLFGGPLSDKHGRRKIMLLGLAVFGLGSILLATANNIEQLWFYRVIQAFGGGITAVCVPALIRDHVSGAQAAKLFSLIALIMMLAPAIAPSIGSLILAFVDWHGIFVFLTLFACLLAVAIIKMLPATQIANPSRPEKTTYWQIFKHPQALKFLVAQACGYSVLLIFLTNAPLIYMSHFSLSSSQFSMLFSCTIAFIIITNRLNAWLLNRYTPQTLLKMFFVLQLLGGLVFLLSAWQFDNNLVMVFIGFTIAVSAISGMGPNSQACFLHYFPEHAGRASAALGFSQYACGAIVSASVAAMYNHTFWPVSIAITLLAITSLLVLTYKNSAS